MPPTQSTPCTICAATGTEIYFDHPRGCLVQCRDCGLIRLDPAPTRESLDAFYADHYQQASVGYFTKAESKLRRSTVRVRQLAARLGREPAGARFLDVGANAGFMCQAARRAGFEPTGVEPDLPAVQWARKNYPNIRFLNSFIESAGLEPASFDAVYCSEVIEHSPDCNGFVAAIAAAMKPGAVLYLTTPDITHWRRPRDLTQWDGYDPPAHCLYFSPRNLTRLLGNHGLAVIHRRLAFKPGIKLFARKEAR